MFLCLLPKQKAKYNPSNSVGLQVLIAQGVTSLNRVYLGYGITSHNRVQPPNKVTYITEQGAAP